MTEPITCEDIERVKQMMLETPPINGGYLLPHWYAYGGMCKVPAEGWIARLFQKLAEMFYRCGLYRIGYPLQMRGSEDHYFPGIVNLASMGQEQAERELEKFRDRYRI